jgi:hypothetical protein
MKNLLQISNFISFFNYFKKNHESLYYVIILIYFRVFYQLSPIILIKNFNLIKKLYHYLNFLNIDTI